jgi:serine/threonine protein kinase
VIEYASNGSLFDLRAAGVTFTDVQTAHFVCDCTRGLHRLHTNSPTPILHRDLKSLNLLLSSDHVVKLADFGEASFTTDSALEPSAFTAHWSAPEVLSDEVYTKMCDIYSLAMCVYELYACVVPFHNVKSRFTVAKKVKEGERPDLTSVAAATKSREAWQRSQCLAADGGAISRPDSTAPTVLAMAPDMLMLMQQSWDQDPRKRPTVEEWVACADRNLRSHVQQSDNVLFGTSNTSRNTIGAGGNTSFALFDSMDSCDSAGPGVDLSRSSLPNFDGRNSGELQEKIHASLQDSGRGGKRAFSGRNRSNRPGSVTSPRGGVESW